MYCKNCGKQIDDDSKFCNYCGTEQTINIYRESNSEKAKIDINLNNQGTQIHPSKTQSKIEYAKQGRYDESYEKESGATVVGFIVLITNFLIVLVKPEVNELLYIAMGIISLVLRIIFTVWIVNIAKRQNRPATQWGFSGFIFPSFTLIIIGLSKKLNNDLQNDQITYTTNANQQEFIDDVDQPKELSYDICNEEYKIVKEEKGWSISTGKYVEYTFEFRNVRYVALFDSKRNKYCYSTYHTVECFNELNECILSYIEYIKNKKNNIKNKR